MFRLGFFILLFFLFHHSVDAQSRNVSSIWRTKDGNPPLVIAKGGFSGLFPDSGRTAYMFAEQVSLKGLVSWCDVQLTKDNHGICIPSMDMGNCTSISYDDLYKPTNEIIKGFNKSGYFPFDYTKKELENITLTQGIFSRTNTLDFLNGITYVGDLGEFNLQSIWLNIQNDMFYSEKNLNMTRFLSDVIGNVSVDYVSSPEVAFLKGIAPIFRGSKTKLIFSFLEVKADMYEPFTNKTYGDLVKDLKFLTTFASGILVPKSYIFPTGADLYLPDRTSIISDAHSIGLEVYAAGFANDIDFPYDFNYNPISEYLAYIDDGNSSVDGVLSDYPISASIATVCFPHLTRKFVGTETPVIISHGGASGVYPDCTDLAYKQAVDDRADFIDCPVQITKDGTLICMSSMDLMKTTTIASSQYGASASDVFTYNLTWEEIQTLRPTISTPFYSDYSIVRNPKHKNDGSFMKLSDFLMFAKNKSSGVAIIIENTAFVARSLGFDVVESVYKELSDSAIPAPKIKIMSTNSSVLIEFKSKTSYDLVYKIDELISDVDASLIQEIKKFATAVAVGKESIFSSKKFFIFAQTKVVNKFQSANLSVYAYVLMNEFLSIDWDFLSDPIVEIHNFVQGAKVDGIITDYPQTASSYRRNKCLNRNNTNYDIPLIRPHLLLDHMDPLVHPPAMSPHPPLMPGDVTEPPLPPVSTNTSTQASPPGSNLVDAATPVNDKSSHGNTLQSFLTSSVFICIAAILLIH